MDCNGFAKKVSDYIDGELGERTHGRVERHAADCPSCAKLLRDLQALVKQLSQLPRVQPSAGFDFALRSRLLMETTKEARLGRKVQRFLFPTLPRTFASAAAILLLALGITLGWRGHTDRLELENEISRSGLPVAIDRGALKNLSHEESYTISSKFYAREDSAQTPAKPVRRQTAPARRVMVRF